MIQVQLKLRPTKAQERQFERWLWHLTGVYNWSVKKIEHAPISTYRSYYTFFRLIVGHSRRMRIPLRVLRGAMLQAHGAWERCWRGLGRRPRLKGRRNRLNSIAFLDPIKPPQNGRILLPGVGSVRFHRQRIDEGLIKCGRVVRRASGWYLCLFIDAGPQPIPAVADGEVGIDPGFASLATLSTGEKVDHPHELRRTSERLAQAQRGNRRRLTARLLERQANQRKDRNHKLSRRLVSENALIAWSDDNHRAIARSFGKSVASAAHGQLRKMLDYKSRAGGRRFVAVSNRYSTMTCSACGARSGPAGYAGLLVRRWRCGCGAEHDRDCNAAVNTLVAARGTRVEVAGDGQPGIAL